MAPPLDQVRIVIGSGDARNPTGTVEDWLATWQAAVAEATTAGGRRQRRRAGGDGLSHSHRARRLQAKSPRPVPRETSRRAARSTQAWRCRETANTRCGRQQRGAKQWIVASPCAFAPRLPAPETRLCPERDLSSLRDALRGVCRYGRLERFADGGTGATHVLHPLARLRAASRRPMSKHRTRVGDALSALSVSFISDLVGPG